MTGLPSPIGIFWLLLAVNLRVASTIGPLYDGVAGMFAGTYIGRSVNFNAIAIEYGIVREGGLYAGSIVVDNIATTIWMAVTLAALRLLAAVWPRSWSRLGFLVARWM